MADKGVTATINSKDFGRAIAALPRLFASGMVEAGHKIGKLVLDTQGLRVYPSETSANRPPEPYYVRGRGTQRMSGGGVSYNDNSSEQYGSQWTVKSRPNRVTIGNSASYAPFLAGKPQARHMRAIGWKKLTVVIQERMRMIKATFQSHIGRAIRKAGFRFR